jgi:polyisoprenoid-binding protein YceI
MRSCVRALLPTVFLLMALRGLAQPQVFTANAATSEVHITLGGSAHTTHGLFHIEGGEIDFDRTAMRIAGSIVVAAGSGDTGNEGRDKKMKEEVLEAPKFAQIAFAPHSYEGTIAPSGDSMIQVKGTFTLHGMPHELTIPMQVHLEEKECTVHAHFLVPYVQWGLKNPSVFLLKVDKQVAVDVMLTGTVRPRS